MKRKLILFYSRRCGKCHAINKRVERLIKEGLFPLEYEKIDVFEQKDLVGKYLVDGVPTVILLDSNKEIKRIKGSMYREDIIDFIK